MSGQTGNAWLNCDRLWPCATSAALGFDRSQWSWRWIAAR